MCKLFAPSCLTPFSIAAVNMLLRTVTQRWPDTLCTAILIPGSFRTNYLYSWSLCALKSVSINSIIRLHDKYFNFICPYQAFALPVSLSRSQVTVERCSQKHRQAIVDMGRHVVPVFVRTMTTRVGCSIFGLRPDQCSLAQLAVTTGSHIVTLRVSWH